MESVLETPTKRRKIDSGHTPAGQAYDSQDDSGDDLFQEHETIATVPLPGRILSPLGMTTQPTQLIHERTQKGSSSSPKPPTIQVAASSPTRVSTSISSPASAMKQNKSAAATIMAPLGTTFRSPLGVIKRTPVIDLSDDEPARYVGDSSDDELQPNRADIKPTIFVQSAKPKPGAQSDWRTMGGISQFRKITAGALYKPLDHSSSRSDPPTVQRSADIMANAYGGSSRPVKQIRQAKPAMAQVIEDISIDDIGDYQVRRKVERMRNACPHYTVRQCRDALIDKKGNVDDALEAMLIGQDAQSAAIDLTSDNDSRPSKVSAPKVSVKQQARPAVKSIQERWAGTHSKAKSSQPTVPPTSSSPIVAVELKPRRRLIQGKNRNPPPAEIPKVFAKQVISTPLRRRSETPDSDDSDSGLDLEDDDRAETEVKVLGFFNRCSANDLADIASITEDLATYLVAQRPFKSLNDVRQVSQEARGTETKRKRTTKKPIGDKIVEKCLDMWKGYEAVDELVKRCEALGTPVANDMKKWGVDVFGSSTNGELDITSVAASPGRDSGIGTPSSISDDEVEGQSKRCSKIRRKQEFFPQPALLSEKVTLKDYQVVGINWLSLLFDRKLSCILADDMGLGKTCQVVSFLAHLKEKKISGPHLIVVPSSTLENWLREFQVFCPQLQAMPYYADQKERELVREEIEARIEDETVDVIVTTYGIAKRKQETKFLRKLRPVVCVFDEGHMLRNSGSEVYSQLMRIVAQFRLILTGTPLQNNLKELVALLGFMLPSVFQEHSEKLEYIFGHKAKTTDGSHSALLSEQRIARARAMMTPFVLRRRKDQVLKYLPIKTRRVEYCELTSSQLEIYESHKQKALKIVQDRAAGIKVGNQSSNIMMALRKASIHPLLFRRLFTESKLKKMAKACRREPEFAESELTFIYEDMEVMTDWDLNRLCEQYPNSLSSYQLDPDVCLDSGKIATLTTLLKTYVANGDRVLIFSQFVMVLDLLEPFLNNLEMPFSRLDGSTSIDTRQTLIDEFTDSDPPIPVFLLSTKAGGAGINLACANKVVIFDSSFNPQDDIQAENRAHRVGQKREVEVVRLVSKGTIEEQILALGETKVALDERVAGVGEGEEDNKRVEEVGKRKVEHMMLQKLKEEEGEKP